MKTEKIIKQLSFAIVNTADFAHMFHIHNMSDFQNFIEEMINEIFEKGHKTLVSRILFELTEINIIKNYSIYDLDDYVDIEFPERKTHYNMLIYTIKNTFIIVKNIIQDNKFTIIPKRPFQDGYNLEDIIKEYLHIQKPWNEICDEVIFQNDKNISLIARKTKKSNVNIKRKFKVSLHYGSNNPIEIYCRKINFINEDLIQHIELCTGEDSYTDHRITHITPTKKLFIEIEIGDNFIA